MTLVWPNGTTDEPARSDGYGPRPSIETKEGPTRPFHVGTDHYSIGKLCSIGAGTVIESGWVSWAGWQVLIYLGEIGGVRTWVRYCHLAAQPPLRRGDEVAAGSYVGLEGETGQAAGVHLHWEIYRGSVDRGSWGNPGTTVDPREFVLAHLNETPDPGEEEDEEMKAMFYMTGKTYNVLVWHPVSGLAHEYSTGSGDYNNKVAANFGTGSFLQVDKSHYDRMKADLANVRAGK